MKIPSPITPRTEPSSRGLAYLDSSASPDSFGAPIAKGLGQFGDAAQNLGATLVQQERSQRQKIEDFDAQRRLTTQNSEFNAEVDEIKKTAPVSGVGTKERVDEAFQKRFFAFQETLPDRLKPEYGAKIESLRSQYDLQTRQFENVASRTYFKTGIDDENSKSKVAVNEAPDLFEAQRAHMFETIDKSGLSEIEKAELKRASEQGLASVRYKALARTNQFSAATMPINGSVAVVVNNILGVESGGNPNAKNPNSSAEGLGQFLNKTWVEQLRLTRPDLAAGQPDEALYALRLDPQISREVATHYTAQNAMTLRNAGIAPTPANLYLAHFLGPTGAQRVLGAKDATPIESVVSSEAMNANRAVFNKTPTVAALKEWARGKMGDADLPRITATQDQQGFWNTPGLEYDLANKVRSYPVTKEYVEKVVPAVRAVDPGLVVKITSGGQESGKGTGSHRHDVDSRGEAGTADIVLMKDGKALSPEKDKAVYAKVIENLAAQGFTGIGHYGWGIHVGGGSRAKWGPDKGSASLDPVFSAAIDRGWAKAADGNRDALDVDPAYRTLPFEDRVALRNDGQREAQAAGQAQLQQEQAFRNANKNQLFTDLFDGKAGQADIDRARVSGVLASFQEISQASEILRKKTEDQSDVQYFMNKFNTPGAVFSPADSDDKKGFNALFNQSRGPDRIAQMDTSYMTDAMIPAVQRVRDIPTDLVGTLTGMLRSTDQKQALYALDALSQLERAEPRAYADRVSSATQADVTRYTTLRNAMPADELLRTINGGNTQEERQGAEMRRKDGEALLAKKDGKVPRIDTLVQEITGSYGSWWQSAPQLGQTAAASTKMERFANEMWLTEYIKSGNEDAATKVTTEAVKKQFGVTELGGAGKKLMELPPERAGYKPVAGTYNWIDREVRTMLDLKPGEKYELQSDEQTRQEFSAFQRGGRPPSYGIIKLDENGVPRAGVFNDKGAPRRVWFQPSQAETKLEEEDFQIRNDAATNRDFFEDFNRMRLSAKAAGMPLPRDVVEEYDMRQARQREIEAYEAKKKQTAIDKYRDIPMNPFQ